MRKKERRERKKAEHQKENTLHFSAFFFLFIPDTLGKKGTQFLLSFNTIDMMGYL